MHIRHSLPKKAGCLEGLGVAFVPSGAAGQKRLAECNGAGLNAGRGVVLRWEQYTQSFMNTLQITFKTTLKSIEF